MSDSVKVQSAPLAPAGKNNVFRPHNPDQGFPLPSSPDDWRPQNQVARFISEPDDELLELSELYRGYEEPDGAPPYDPRMPLKSLL